MTKPNFFLVGAPKCGTTAMNTYLEAHPQIYMCPHKEIHHFATDLPHHRNLRFASREAYLQLFSGVIAESVVGEASVFYLYSVAAAAEIHRLTPDARVLAMIRNPVDWVASYHSQLVLNAEEDLPLEAALSAQADRKQGNRLPTRVQAPNFLLYDKICRFSEQIERFQGIFGRQRVMVLLLDDLKADADRAYRRVLEFLEVDQTFHPEFSVINANQEAISASFGRLVSRPPDRLRAAVRAVLPWSVAARIRDTLKRVNQRTRARPDLTEPMRADLVDRYHDEIERLAAVLDRDLSQWLTT